MMTRPLRMASAVAALAALAIGANRRRHESIRQRAQELRHRVARQPPDESHYGRVGRNSEPYA